jgi:hypothetical protein
MRMKNKKRETFPAPKYSVDGSRSTSMIKNGSVMGMKDGGGAGCVDDEGIVSGEGKVDVTAAGVRGGAGKEGNGKDAGV